MLNPDATIKSGSRAMDALKVKYLVWRTDLMLAKELRR